MEYLLIGLAIAGFAVAVSASVRVERLEPICWCTRRSRPIWSRR